MVYCVCWKLSIVLFIMLVLCWMSPQMMESVQSGSLRLWDSRIAASMLYTSSTSWSTQHRYVSLFYGLKHKTAQQIHTFVTKTLYFLCPSPLRSVMGLRVLWVPVAGVEAALTGTWLQEDYRKWPTRYRQTSVALWLGKVVLFSVQFWAVASEGSPGFSEPPRRVRYVIVNLSDFK